MRAPYLDRIIKPAPGQASYGAWQHLDDQGRILPQEAYALDDQTRFVVLLLWLIRAAQAAGDQPELSQRLPQLDLAFDCIHRMQIPGTPQFYGFLDEHGRLSPTKPGPCSDDAFAQVAWTMGACLRHGFRTQEALRLWELVAPHLTKLEPLRARAYGLLGVVDVDDNLAARLADSIADQFMGRPDQAWPEPKLTYGLALVPYALLAQKDPRHHELALDILRFVLDVYQHQPSDHPGILVPIGNNNGQWYTPGHEQPPRHGQQPIDIGYLALALLAASARDPGSAWAAELSRCVGWFSGQNTAGISLIGPQGQCFDGIDGDGGRAISRHSGAESNLARLATVLAVAFNAAYPGNTGRGTIVY